jgi:hypothetical protein
VIRETEIGFFGRALASRPSASARVPGFAVAAMSFLSPSFFLSSSFLGASAFGIVRVSPILRCFASFKWLASMIDFTVTW